MNKHLFNAEATNAYIKTLKVIDGCQTLEQLSVAISYSDLFKSKFTNTMDIDVFTIVINNHIETMRIELDWQ